MINCTFSDVFGPKNKQFVLAAMFTEFMENHGSKWFTILGLLLVLVFVIIFIVLKFNA